MAALGLVLVHSPLLGVFCWQNVAVHLRAVGYDTIVPDFVPVLLKHPPFYPKIADVIAQAADSLSGEIVLVGHSGAGALLPVVARAIGRKVRGALFVDAILPHPRKTWFDTVPPDFAARVRALSSNGFLPPWHEWWPLQVMAGLLPDDMERKNFAQKLERRPLAYFDEMAPDIDLPALVQCRYLQLSPAYEVEAEMARGLGWSVDYCPLGHLAMLTDAINLGDCIQHAARS